MLASDLASARTQITVFVSVLILITLLGAVVRAVVLAEHPMRYDESFNYMHYGAYSPGFIATNYFPNNHVLHTLLVRVSIFLFGSSPAALRLPAFVGGVLLIPATAWFGWTLSRNRFVALLSALAVCTSSPLIEYSANARGYSWLTLFTLLLTICTLHLFTSPSKRWLWVCWGLIGAFGAYTIPLMLFPVSGLSLALLYGVLSSPGGSEKRKDLARGLIVGLGICVTLTFAAYLPIVIAQGVDGLRETNHLTYTILSRQVESFGGMLLSICGFYVRDSHVFWPWLIVLGLTVYLLSILRNPTPQGLAPLSVLACGLVIAAVIRAPLPARAWLFALPIVLACTMHGICELRHAIGFGRFTRRVPAMAAGALLVVATAAPLVAVCRTPYLCSEHNGLVEVEEVLDECKRLGPERCAIVSPYNPAITYYRVQKDMAVTALPSAPATVQVFIIADEQRPLEELWHAGIDGFANFDTPRVWRELAQATVFVAHQRTVGWNRSGFEDLQQDVKRRPASPLSADAVLQNDSERDIRHDLP